MGTAEGLGGRGHAGGGEQESDERVASALFYGWTFL